MKIFLLPLFLFLLLTEIILPQAVAPVQGDVVINTFDSKWGVSSRAEIVVLVNRTNTTINLDGYELQSFGTDGEDEKYGYYIFTPLDTMPSYSFLLISSYTGEINGVSRDRAWVELSDTLLANNWPDNGYLALRAINPVDSSDYIDIVKHNRTGVGFTGYPLYSEILLTDVPFEASDGQIATRGGVSGDINSCHYTGYGYPYYFNDFTALPEASVTIQNAGSAPLPVELSSFSAVVLKSTVKLNWRTETEVNNYGFEVERQIHTSTPLSMTGWEKIGFVNGNGNSNSPKNYSYEDDNVTAGKPDYWSGRYSYRLKQIDNDGKYEYSKTIEVNLNVPGKFELSQNYPNPFNPTTTIRFTIAEAGNVKLTLFNILGQELRTLIDEFKETGIHTINLNASELNSGLYIYKLESNGLTQTRKMTLVK